MKINSIQSPRTSYYKESAKARRWKKQQRIHAQLRSKQKITLGLIKLFYMWAWETQVIAMHVGGNSLSELLCFFISLYSSWITQHQNCKRSKCCYWVLNFSGHSWFVFVLHSRKMLTITLQLLTKMHILSNMATFKYSLRNDQLLEFP